MAGQQQENEAEREHVWRRRVGRLKRRAWGRRLVNAFIVWQVFAVTVWLLPHDWPFVRNFVPAYNDGPIRAYLTLTNFGQDWQMFAPEPDRRDQTIDAVVTLADGQTRQYNFPRMRDLGYVDRYRRERFRKLIEVAGHDYWVWPALARYAARRCDTDPHTPPVRVTLIKRFRDIPPPGQPLPPFQDAPFYETPITPEDLR